VFLAIILGSSVILGFSAYYQADTYRAFSFNMEITEIQLFKNETSGTYRHIIVHVRVNNPSFTTPLQLLWTETRIFLNGSTLRYAWGQKGPQIVLQPGESHDFGWYYPTPEDDWELLQGVEASGIWNWFLFLEPYVNAGFLESTQVIRLNTFVGVTIVPV
jgi:hypothetical protein